jgi:3-oxo-4,17-pregnadiene-20-carboxyl-CoA hydratase alpha subunit
VTAGIPRPAPAAADDAQFWSFVDDGELRLQRCAACAAFRHPPRPVCAECGSRESEWVAASGHGVVWSFTVIHPPTVPSFAERTPYGAVVVRLDEGVFLVSNIVDCGPDDLAVEMPVDLAITEVEPGLRLPLFRRA